MRAVNAAVTPAAPTGQVYQGRFGGPRPVNPLPSNVVPGRFGGPRPVNPQSSNVVPGRFGGPQAVNPVAPPVTYTGPRAINPTPRPMGGTGSVLADAGGALAQAGIDGFFDWAYPQPYLPPGSVGPLPGPPIRNPDAMRFPSLNKALGIPEFIPGPPLPVFSYPNQTDPSALQQGPLTVPAQPATGGAGNSPVAYTATYKVRQHYPWGGGYVYSYTNTSLLSSRFTSANPVGPVGAPARNLSGTILSISIECSNGPLYLNLGGNISRNISGGWDWSVLEFSLSRLDGQPEPAYQPATEPEYAPAPGRNPGRPRTLPAPNLPTQPQPGDLPWPLRAPTPAPGRFPFAPPAPDPATSPNFTPTPLPNSTPNPNPLPSPSPGPWRWPQTPTLPQTPPVKIPVRIRPGERPQVGTPSNPDLSGNPQTNPFIQIVQQTVNQTTNTNLRNPMVCRYDSKNIAGKCDRIKDVVDFNKKILNENLSPTYEGEINLSPCPADGEDNPPQDIRSSEADGIPGIDAKLNLALDGIAALWDLLRCGPDESAGVAIPETWNLKKSISVDQMVIVTKPSANDGSPTYRRSFTIPHPRYTTQRDIETLKRIRRFKYRRGSFQATIQLADNSCCVLNCFNRAEAKRTSDYVLSLISRDWARGAVVKITEKIGLEINPVPVEFHVAKYYSSSDERLLPDWSLPIP